MAPSHPPIPPPLDAYVEAELSQWRSTLYRLKAEGLAPGYFFTDSGYLKHSCEELFRREAAISIGFLLGVLGPDIIRAKLLNLGQPDPSEIKAHRSPGHQVKFPDEIGMEVGLALGAWAVIRLSPTSPHSEELAPAPGT